MDVNDSPSMNTADFKKTIYSDREMTIKSRRVIDMMKKHFFPSNVFQNSPRFAR